MNSNHPKQSNILELLFKRLHKKNAQQDNATNLENTLLDYYTSFVQKHPDAIILLSLDGEIVSHNTNSLQKQIGYYSNKMMTYKKFIPKEDYLLLISAFEKAIKGIVSRVEFSADNMQGEPIALIGTFIPIETTPRKIDGIFLILKDITAHKQLVKSNELYASHLEQTQQIAQIGSFKYIIEKDEINCSKALSDIFGFEASEKISLSTPLSFVHPEDIDALNRLLDKAIHKGIGYTTEYRIFHGKTGELRYIKVILEVEREKNKPAKLIGVVYDDTDQKKLDIQLKETIKDYRHIFDHLDVGIWMRESMDGKLIFASQGLQELLQIPLSTLYDQPDSWREMVLPSHHEKLQEHDILLSKGERIELKFQLTDGKGTTKWVYEQTIPRMNEAGEITHIFGMISDISHDIEMQERLEFLAKNDALTSLPNVHSLHEKLDQFIMNNEMTTFALFCMDLDNFNAINNHLGHHIGDRLLQKVANKLIDLLPKNSYLAKVGGDGFIFIIPGYENKDRIFQFAKEIIQKVGEKVIVEDYKLHITASLGISFYPDNGDKKLTLLENAHAALYHAKNLGKNNYQIYSFDRDIGSHKKYLLEMDLRKAIQNEEFELYYQAQVNPKNGVMEGAEALIRWNHKEWGIISPAEFIPIAEEKHLIHPIGDWVIRNVCRQLQIWKEKGYTLYPIAINISPIRFLQPGLVETIKKGLNDFQIPGKLLEIEITESSLIKDEKGVSETLQEIKRLGVRIALDDFGTGYSSFHYLQKFDLDTLKIDRMFIRNFNSEKDTCKDSAIISSLLHLAKGLEMKVVAEGVEEYEQLEFLKQKECDLIQGYLYSKPIPVDQFEQMMKRRYLYPKKQKGYIKPDKEHRKYFRFAFPKPLPAKMLITEVNKREVQMGSATILVENISLGGIRFLSTLILPVSSNIKLKFQIEIMNQSFEMDGLLVYKNEEKSDVLSYGVSFQMTEGEKDGLAEIINKMTLLKKFNNEIPDTNFIEESPFAYLANTLH